MPNPDRPLSSSKSIAWEGNNLKRQLEFWLPTTGAAAFQPLTKPAAKSVFTTLFPNLVAIVTAIAEFFHSSIIYVAITRGSSYWFYVEGRAAQSEAKMRNVIFAINIAVDGCCDHTKFNPDEETHEYFTHLTRDADLLVFGRKTYQLMVPYWPDVAKNPSETKTDREFAETFVSKNKIVFSRSLESAEDKNTTIVRTNLQDEIVRLKNEQGKYILVGGVSIPSQLIELGLVDEYRFVVLPIIAGEGRRLLEGISLQEKLQLKLVESKIFKSGSVALRYLKQ
jgi:dihydrofolate reductase